MFYSSTLKQAKYYKKLIELRSCIAIIDYQVSVHSIYIERCMHKTWFLNRININSEKEILEKIIRYYTQWKYQFVTVMGRLNMSRINTNK